jgi:hypothetical protein
MKKNSKIGILGQQSINGLVISNNSKIYRHKKKKSLQKKAPLERFFLQNFFQYCEMDNFWDVQNSNLKKLLVKKVF